MNNYSKMHAPGNSLFIPESEKHKKDYESRLKYPEAWIQSIIINARYRLACHEIEEPPYRDIMKEERKRKHDEYWRLFGSMELNFILGSPYARRNDHPGGLSGLEPPRMNDHPGGLS